MESTPKENWSIVKSVCHFGDEIKSINQPPSSWILLHIKWAIYKDIPRNKLLLKKSAWLLLPSICSIVPDVDADADAEPSENW